MKRREFLRNAICAGLGGAGLDSAFGNLQLMHAATRAYGPAAFSDYKALVCVFLHGGNDGFNTVVPHSDAAYNQYRIARATLALPRDQLLPLLPQAGGGASDGANYALYAATGEGNPVGASGLRDLFNSGKAAILANVGALMRPTTKAQYHSGSHALPPLLFSHDAQQNYWQISRTDDLRNLGWGGRIADLLHDANPGGFIPMLTGLGGESLLGRAAVATQFVTGTGGPNVFSHTAWNAERRAVMNEIMKPAEQKHPMERAYAAAYIRTRDTAASVRDALEATPELATVFPDTGLGMQLRMVAQLIAARNILGMKRQIYFVGMGGFDTHDFQMSSHAGLLSTVAQAITAFQRATTELGDAVLQRRRLRPWVGLAPPGGGWRGERRPLLRAHAAAAERQPRGRGLGPDHPHHLGGPVRRHPGTLVRRGRQRTELDFAEPGQFRAAQSGVHEGVRRCKAPTTQPQRPWQREKPHQAWPIPFAS